MVFLADCSDSLMKRTIPCIKTGKKNLSRVDVGALLEYLTAERHGNICLTSRQLVGTQDPGEKSE